MYLIRHIFSLSLFLCVAPLSGLFSLASPLNPSLPGDLSVTQQVNGSSNPLSDFLNNVKEGVNIARQSYPAAVLYYMSAFPVNRENSFTSFHNVEIWRITLCFLKSDQLRTPPIVCIKSLSTVWGQWNPPYKTFDPPTPPYPAAQPNPWDLNGVLVGPITAWNKAKARVASGDPCIFVGLRKPSGSGRDLSPFQSPEIMWSFRFSQPLSWVYVGAATGQVKAVVDSIEGNNGTMGSSSDTSILYETNCTQNATTGPLLVDSEYNICAF